MVKDFGIEAQSSPAIEVIDSGSHNDSWSAATTTVAGATTMRTNRDKSHQSAHQSPRKPQRGCETQSNKSWSEILLLTVELNSFESETLLNLRRAALMTVE